MDVQALVAIGGALAAIIAAVTAIVRTRGENTNKSSEIKQELDKQIDARVASQLQEAWARITSLELRVGTLTADRDFQKSAVRTLGEGFEVLSDVVERTDPRPDFTRREKQTIDEARALWADDSLWKTQGGPATA